MAVATAAVVADAAEDGFRDGFVRYLTLHGSDPLVNSKGKRLDDVVAAIRRPQARRRLLHLRELLIDRERTEATDGL